MYISMINYFDMFGENIFLFIIVLLFLLLFLIALLRWCNNEK